MAKRKEVQVAGPVGKPISPREHMATPDEKGLWFLVNRDLERNHVRYFPVNHHLILEARCPEKVPSMGGVKNGDNMIPVDKSGMINLADATPGEIVSLMANGTVRPVRPSKRLERIIAEGKQVNVTTVVDIVPGMRRVNTPQRQYEQATSVQLTPEGAMNLDFARRSMPNPL
ncbi:MAG: hypothetical protein WBA09_22325 [Candidatus Acidiferrum sp.]